MAIMRKRVWTEVGEDEKRDRGEIAQNPRAWGSCSPFSAFPVFEAGLLLLRFRWDSLDGANNLASTSGPERKARSAQLGSATESVKDALKG